MPALEVSVTEPPAQKLVGPPGFIVAVGSAFTVIVTEFDLLHPVAEMVSVSV